MVCWTSPFVRNEVLNKLHPSMTFPFISRLVLKLRRLFCLIPAHNLFWVIATSFRKRNKSCIALIGLIPDYLPYSRILGLFIDIS